MPPVLRRLCQLSREMPTCGSRGGSFSHWGSGRHLASPRRPRRAGRTLSSPRLASALRTREFAALPSCHHPHAAQPGLFPAAAMLAAPAAPSPCGHRSEPRRPEPEHHPPCGCSVPGVGAPALLTWLRGRMALDRTHPPFPAPTQSDTHPSLSALAAKEKTQSLTVRFVKRCPAPFTLFPRAAARSLESERGVTDVSATATRASGRERGVGALNPGGGRRAVGTAVLEVEGFSARPRGSRLL